MSQAKMVTVIDVLEEFGLYKKEFIMRTVIKISSLKMLNGTDIHVNDLLRYGRSKCR